ncbi:unnamed protein product, partial [Polarella glacialis]
ELADRVGEPNPLELHNVFLGRGIGAVIGTLLGGWLSDRSPIKRAMCCCIGFSACSVAAVPIVASYQSVRLLAFCFALIGMSGSALVSFTVAAACWSFPGKDASETALSPKARISYRHTQDASETVIGAAFAGAQAGALVLGAAMSAAGLISGAATGAALGSLAAPLTFGLSVPFAAAFSSAVGHWAGGVAGVGCGAVAGAWLAAAARALGGLHMPWLGPLAGKLPDFLVFFLLVAITGPPVAAVGAVMGLTSGALLGIVIGVALLAKT